MKKWFFIASRRTWTVEWENIKSDWEKYKNRTPWGIPDVSKDIEKLDRVSNGDIILCYDAAPKTKIIGCCICDGRYNDNPEPGFSNGIFICEFKEYVNPIKFSELRKKSFNFINDFLGNNNGRGRSIVEINNDDWDKFKKIYYPRQLVPILVPSSEEINILIISCRSNQPHVRQINRATMTIPSF